MKVKLNSYLIIALAFVVAGVILLAGQIKNGRLVLPTITVGSSSQKLAEKAIDYINKNLVQPGVTATIVKISDVGNVYKLDMKVAGQNAESYVTKDGKFFFPEGFDMSVELPAQGQSNNSAPASGNASGGGCGI
ncbi:MAG: hypothetical protein A2117_01125 [Candidatus Wildermuthbacteria bacterium GWA2_46_15]|uniref:Uncharacterized protein n=1 Tax=Candidatus Wildermuthbacteria bacterium GWA2_46_15 TaxID=1802443 RepID=A0A1G2QN60_9BACT|nr:MAG: hypothetical protein A2117_01125 [Candidatus Wildermuthbacteria bacterium GWA2_46_15]